MDISPKDITQVKRLNETTTVVWTTPNGRHVELHELHRCPDPPGQDFLDQMDTVEADLIARTGFGKKFGDGVTLTGVSVTKNSGGRKQFVPTIMIGFGWGEVGAATPLLLAPDDEGKRTTGENVLTDVELRNIEHLFELAAAYAGGERHQTGLGLEDGGEEEVG